MKLLLKEDVSGLGYCGDEVKVKDGYGRNYLVPQGKAILATPKNLKQFAHQKSIVLARTKKVIQAATDLAAQIEKVSCVFKKKVGDQGKLFGSVTSREIADKLSENGVEIDKRKIHLTDSIRSLGEFKVPIVLHSQVKAHIRVSVVKDAQDDEAAVDAAPAVEATEEKAEDKE